MPKGIKMGSQAVRTVQMVAPRPRMAKSLLREVECGAPVAGMAVEGMSTARRKRRTVAEPKSIARG